MTQSDKIEYLVCYDIANPRRLGKIYRFLKKMAIPIQYSVFVAKWSNEELNRFMHYAGKLIKVEEDDIRIYHIAKDEKILNFGKKLISQDIIIGGITGVEEYE